MELLIQPLTLSPVTLIHCVYLAIVLFGLALSIGDPQLRSLRIILVLVALLLMFNLWEENRAGGSLLVTPVFTLGFGPAFYWFCQQWVYGEPPTNRQVALHLSPMFAALPFTLWPQAVIAVGSLSQLVYLFIALGRINHYHRTLKQISSNSETVSLHWLNGVLIAVMAMMLQDLARLNLQPYAPLEWLQLWYFVNTCGYAILISYLTLMALRKPETFDHFREMEQLLQTTNAKTDQKTDDPDAAILFQQIDKKVRSERLFLQSRFSLRDLASSTGLHERQISWIINQGGELNFSDYINQCRVQAACEHFAKHPDANILETALAAGFSSKSAFNTAFKKLTGLTPSQFCKNQAANPLKGAES